MTIKKIVLTHVMVLVLAIALLVLSAEALLRKFAAGWHDETTFLLLVVVGSIVIFLSVLLSFILFVIFKRKRSVR